MVAETLRRWRPRVLIAVALAAVLATASASPPLDYLHRLGIDLLLPLRHSLFGPQFPAEDSDVVAVVIDEETYRTPPFAGTPEVAWTPFLARVLSAVAAGGPKIIGLDLVYPTSLDRRGLVRGYDKPLLKSFFKIGRAGRLVLGKMRLSQGEIRPYAGLVNAAGGTKNLRSLKLILDGDDVVRRHPTRFATEGGGFEPSFAAELARRAGARVREGEFLINYNTGTDDIPVFGLSDLFACAEKGEARFFERFRDKIVIFGTALDVEDRRLSAKRYTLGRPERSRHPRCVGTFDKERFGELVARRSMPGLFIHAAAVNTLTKDRALALAAPALRFAIVFAATVVAALLFFALPPIAGFAAGAALFVAETGLSLLAFTSGTVWPLVMLAVAGLLVFTAVYAFRFVIEDKQKRWIQHSFRHFLAPVLVDRLADDPSVLELGGTRREVTVFFSDLAGFTTVSENMKDTPEVLVDILNRYLTVVTDIIEKHEGYVDKFIGDAVMAIWGAPLDDAHAERNAVNAALEAQEALIGFNDELVESHPEVGRLHTRMGINTGLAVVGNMGSKTRLNYTVGGDTVNIAARLEGANKLYGSLVLVGDNTAAGLGDGYVMRCVDNLTVKGRNEPLPVHEVLGHAGRTPDDLIQRVTVFNEAYTLYLARQFAAAREAFSRHAEIDPISALYVERCDQYIAAPPEPDWDGSFVATQK